MYLFFLLFFRTFNIMYYTGFKFTSCQLIIFEWFPYVNINNTILIFVYVYVNKINK